MLKLFIFLCFSIATFWTTVPFFNVETTNTEVSKKILIAPKFDTNFVWNQKVNVSTMYLYEDAVLIQNINLTMEGRINKIADLKPVSIIFSNVSGEQHFIENEDKIDIFENKNGKITATVDSNYCLVNEKDFGKLRDDIFLAYSPGSFIGFMPTDKKLKIGDSWSSGTVIPLGDRTFKKNKFQFSEVEGNFTLTKYDNSTAFIEWNGTAKATDQNGDAYKVSWVRQVEFDRINNFFKSNKGKINFQSDKLQINYKVDITAEFL